MTTNTKSATYRKVAKDYSPTVRKTKYATKTRRAVNKGAA